MNKPLKKIINFYLPFLLILIVGIFPSCAGKKHAKTMIYEDEWVVVRLEVELTHGKQIKEKNYNHPIIIKEEQLTALLASIYYRKNPVVLKKSKKLLPAFSEGEMKMLVPHLVTALAKANSNQRIYFSSKAVKSGFLFARDTLSNGIIFISGKNFNIAFANINYDLKGSEASSTDTGFYTGDPLDKDASNRLWELVPQGDQTLAKIMHPKKDKVSTRNNWLVMPLRISEPAKVDKEPVSVPESQTITPKQVSPELIPEQKQEPSELEKPLEYIPKVETSEPPKKEVYTPDKDYEKNVREKLQELKELREDGLISEEEYQRMKKRILEDRY